MQRLPFPHLVAQRYDHGELQAAVSGVVQNDVPDELHKKGILHQRTPEARVYLDEMSKYGSVLGLDTIRGLLRELGNPQASASPLSKSKAPISSP